MSTNISQDRSKEIDRITTGEDYWYCPLCKAEVDNKNVTFEELHDKCGHWVIYVINTKMDDLDKQIQIGKAIMEMADDNFTETLLSLHRETSDPSINRNDYGFKRRFSQLEELLIMDDFFRKCREKYSGDIDTGMVPTNLFSPNDFIGYEILDMLVIDRENSIFGTKTAFVYRKKEDTL